MFPVSIRSSAFDSRFGLQHLLWSSTSNSGFDSSSGGITDFELQGLRLLRSSPSGFDACFGFPCALWQMPSAWAGWGGAGTAGVPRYWTLAGAWTGRGRATSRQPPCPSSSAVNQSCYTLFKYTTATVMLNFVGDGRCCGALTQYAGLKQCFGSTRQLLPYFYFIITSLLPVMTVIMALWLRIFTRHYYVLIRLILHHYYLLLLL